MARRSNTRALSGRNPANSPATHGIMSPEFYNEASPFRISLDRQGMNLGLQHGGRFGNPLAESNDQPSDVNDAINTPAECRIGKGIEQNATPSGVSLKGYGR